MECLFFIYVLVQGVDAQDFGEVEKGRGNLEHRLLHQSHQGEGEVGEAAAVVVTQVGVYVAHALDGHVLDDHGEVLKVGDLYNFEYGFEAVEEDLEGDGALRRELAVARLDPEDARGLLDAELALLRLVDVPVVVDLHGGEVLDHELALDGVVHESVLEHDRGEVVALGEDLPVDAHHLEFHDVGHPAQRVLGVRQVVAGQREALLLEPLLLRVVRHVQLHRLVLLDVELGGVDREVLHVHVPVASVLALAREQLEARAAALVRHFEHHLARVAQERRRTHQHLLQVQTRLLLPRDHLELFK